MEYAKVWWKSRGVWGSLAGGLTGAWTFFEGVKTYAEAHQGEAATLLHAAQATYDNASSVIVILSSFLAWYGRVYATHTINSKHA